MTKILTPPQPAPVMDIARELLPPGMELVVADPSKPEFYDAAADAEYYLGSPRHGIGNEFFGTAESGRVGADLPRQAGCSAEAAANAGRTSCAKRRSDAGPPALLSSTYSAPPARRISSLAARASGVP